MRKGKAKTVKRTKDEEVNGQGRIKGRKGVPRPHMGQCYQKNRQYLVVLCSKEILHFLTGGVSC